MDGHTCPSRMAPTRSRKKANDNSTKETTTMEAFDSKGNEATYALANVFEGYTVDTPCLEVAVKVTYRHSMHIGEEN